MDTLIPPRPDVRRAESINPLHWIDARMRDVLADLFMLLADTKTSDEVHEARRTVKPYAEVLHQWETLALDRATGLDNAKAWKR